MNSSTTDEALGMGRVTVDVRLANNRDVQMLEGGALAPDQVRRVSLSATVDSGANWLVLPTAVADQLGLPKLGTLHDKREIADQVQVELLGRTGTFRAILEPQRSTALIGAIVLEDLDLLVDCNRQQLLPRDPNTMTCEVE